MFKNMNYYIKLFIINWNYEQIKSDKNLADPNVIYEDENIRNNNETYNIMAFKDAISINRYDFKLVQNPYRYRIIGSNN